MFGHAKNKTKFSKRFWSKTHFLGTKKLHFYIEFSHIFWNILYLAQWGFTVINLYNGTIFYSCSRISGSEKGWLFATPLMHIHVKIA